MDRFDNPIAFTPQNSDRNVWQFASAPNLHPMKVTVNVHKPGTDTGYLFVAPYEYYDTPTIGQTGSLIMDQAGNPIWFNPSGGSTQMRDFKVQVYFGKPVLTYWQGIIAGTLPEHDHLPRGEPLPGGCFQIINQHYEVIRTISARKGYVADNHELILTKRNTALFLAIKRVPVDLSIYGGQGIGYIRNYSIQEIDLLTDELIFFWDALSHINPRDSHILASTVTEPHRTWDPFHLNSVEDGPNETLLVSMRDMWAIYKIDKKNGNIIWQLGGEKSDFTVEPDASFSWQHDARFHSETKISLFNNACCGSPTSSPQDAAHGLILELDEEKWTAKKHRTYYHHPPLYPDHQGNMQQLSNRNQFVGWGVQPYLSEFNEAGNSRENPSLNLIYDMTMPNHTYRAYKQKWVGLPLNPPSAAAIKLRGGGTMIYASWNGSTETVAWQVFAGPTPYTISVVTPSVPRTGFETSIYVPSMGPYFQVNALDCFGRIIGISIKQI